jgi:hypothetical protein
MAKQKPYHDTDSRNRNSEQFRQDRAAARSLARDDARLIEAKRRAYPEDQPEETWILNNG